MPKNKAADQLLRKRWQRRLVTLSVVVVMAAVVGVAVWWFWPRDTTAVTEHEALADFRDRAGTTTTAATGDTAGTTRAVPRPGVYTYAAAGREIVKLGPFPEERRPLPDEVTAVVVDEGAGCFSFRLNLFAEHTEDTRYCTSNGSLELASHEKHQRIGALSPTATMNCEQGVLMVPGETERPLRCTLELAGGPMKVKADFSGSATAGEAELLKVGAESVEVTPLMVRYDVTGSVSGTWSETLWLTAEHLPVRIERNLKLSGPANFDEKVDLELTDLTPST